MPGRFLLLVAVLAVFAGGCATVAEERLSLLEAAVLDLQIQEMRLASLEETVAGLVAHRKIAPETPMTAHTTVPPENARGQLGPRRVYAEPAPAQPPATVFATPPSPPVAVATPPQVPSVAAPVGNNALAAPVGNNALAARAYQAALSVLESGKPREALECFRKFLADHPGHALAPNAGYWLGECHYSMKQYDSAIIAFKDVVAQYPGHEKAAAAMVKAGYSYALLGDTANARFYLEALIRDFPSSQPASLAKAKLASL